MPVVSKLTQEQWNELFSPKETAGDVKPGDRMQTITDEKEEVDDDVSV
jgi:hypothetical protein